MPSKFELLIFDWDGTLADSTQAIVDALNVASQETGLPQPSEQASRAIIGLELRQALRTLFGEVDEQQLQQLVRSYHRHYSAVQDDIPLFAGAGEALRELAGNGHLLAVASGKGRRGLTHAIQSSGVGDIILASRSADDCHSKPHPQMLHEIMDELGVEAERAVMIGDTTFDLQMASNAGVSSLGVTYGAQPLENLLPHSPLATFDSFATLHAWLCANA